MKIILKMYMNENIGGNLFVDVIANKYSNIGFAICEFGNRTISSL